MKTIIFSFVILLGGMQSVFAQTNWNPDDVTFVLKHVLKYGEKSDKVAGAGMYLPDGTALGVETSSDTIIYYGNRKIGFARIFTAKPRNFQENMFAGIDANTVASALAKIAEDKPMPATPLIEDKHPLVKKLLDSVEYLESDSTKCKYSFNSMDETVCLSEGIYEDIRILYYKNDIKIAFEFNPGLPLAMGTQDGGQIDFTLLEKVLDFRGE